MLQKKKRNKMKIDVGYVDQSPLSVDTENDLIAVSYTHLTLPTKRIV